MANHKSALKRARQNEQKRLRNQIRKTRVKNMVKATRAAAEENPAEAMKTLRETISIIDRAASKGTLHPRTASRKIARLSKMVAKAQTGEQV